MSAALVAHIALVCLAKRLVELLAAEARLPLELSSLLTIPHRLTVLHFPRTLLLRVCFQLLSSGRRLQYGLRSHSRFRQKLVKSYVQVKIGF